MRLWRNGLFFYFARELKGFFFLSTSCVYTGILEAGVRPGAAANGNMDMLLVSQWRHGHSALVSQWPQSFHQRQKRWIPHTSGSHVTAFFTGVSIQERPFFLINKKQQYRDWKWSYHHCYAEGLNSPRCGGTWRDNLAHLEDEMQKKNDKKNVFFLKMRTPPIQPLEDIPKTERDCVSGESTERTNATFTISLPSYRWYF